MPETIISHHYLEKLAMIFQYCGKQGRNDRKAFCKILGDKQSFAEFLNLKKRVG